MKTAQTIAYVTLGMALLIKLMGQLCLMGRDPVPEAAEACATLATGVMLVGLGVAGACTAFHLGAQEARRSRAVQRPLPWHSLEMVATVSVLLWGLGLLCLRIPYAAASLPLGDALLWSSGPLFAVTSLLVLLGSLSA